jgi:NADPH:quinone reductase
VRAVVIHETGGPEVLHLEEVPQPEPAEGEVLIRVEAAGVNRFDLNQRARRREPSTRHEQHRRCRR